MRSDESEPDRDPLDMLAEEFADRLRRGEHPSVSDYAAAHPEHADDLKELLPAVAQMEMLKRFRGPAAPQSLPDRLGDFRIVRELGRGGMGVVFEAVQESLGRPVALKVLARHAQLDAGRRERFVREAQAAARLHHTNIVPVFGVGEQDGLPYYVMQLIPGCGLHAVVRKWREQVGKGTTAHETQARHPDTKPDAASGPTTVESAVSAPDYEDWLFIADVGLQAAHALHYAHRQGILHRDVKPANLILDGETVWVTDFGLAKLMNVDGLTATGDILVTLQYLPPECLHGEADARSDVYGLGATLYELLTLEPPYAADSPAKLIKQVSDADPPHPREINPNIPRDLETIVLKAMAREPSARYQTARELAEDLKAFLDDRPIRARRISSLSWAWRWCRRHKAVASLALSTLVALTLAAVAGWVGYARTTDALGRETEQRENAEQAKGEADLARRNAEAAKADAQQKSEQLEKNLEQSLETVRQVFEKATGSNRPGFGVSMSVMMGGPGPRPGGWFGGPFGGPGGGAAGPGGPKKEPPPGGPGGDPGGFFADPAADKAAILEAVLNFYDNFAQQRAPTEHVQFEAAKASRRVCEVLAQKDPKKAMVAYNRAVGLLEPLVEKDPEDVAQRTELALTYLAAPPDAFPGDRQQPLRRAAELVAGDQWLAGAVQFRIGSLREQSRDWAGAESAYRAAVAAFVSVPQASRPTPGHLEPAFARLQLAAVLGRQDRLPQAREVLDESIAALRPAADRFDGRGPHPEREALGMTYRALEDVCRRMKDDRGEKEARDNAALYPAFGFGGKKDDRKKDFGPPKKE